MRTPAPHPDAAPRPAAAETILIIATASGRNRVVSAGDHVALCRHAGFSWRRMTPT